MQNEEEEWECNRFCFIFLGEKELLVARVIIMNTNNWHRGKVVYRLALRVRL